MNSEALDINVRALRELVDLPQERLDVEYKAWVDLADNSTRAKVARHVCALANHGGGHLVFGINNDMNPSGPRPATTVPFDQDTLTGIVKRYLVPTFQVTVREVAAQSGNIHPVVWVPPHGAVPICCKRSGPDQPTGSRAITQGTHYVRAPGPASEPVTTPELWAPIIRRCVLHDRQALLSAFNAALRPATQPVDPDTTLLQWHEAGRRAFLEAAAQDPGANKIKQAHFQLSYRIATAHGEDLGMLGFVDELRRMGNEVRQLVDTGWPMFVLFDEPQLRPRSITDEESAVDESLQCRLLGADRQAGGIPELWRASPSGLATLVRAYYLEDFSGWGDLRRLAPGEWLWPEGVARDLAELIRHASAFSQRLETAETVSFRAEWWGLKGRRLDAPQVPLLRSRHDLAEGDSCVATKTVPIAELGEGWRSLTATLLSRLLRMFDARASVSSEQIDAWSNNFRK